MKYEIGRHFFLMGLALAGLVSCGKPPAVTPVPPRGEVIGTLKVPEALSASRLSLGGCMQVVQLASGKRVVEFSPQECPAGQTLVSSSSVVFQLELQSTETKDRFLLKDKDAFVGEVVLVSDRPPFVWEVQQLCQISSPAIHAVSYYGEICRLEFETSGDKAGAFRSLQRVPIEELARSKVASEQGLRSDQRQVGDRASQLEISRDRMRRESDQLRADLQETRNMLSEARRALHDASKSNLAVHRQLERKLIETRIKEAELRAQYLNLDIDFATREARQAELIKARLGDSEKAKNRDAELGKQLETFRRVGIQDSDQFKQIKSFYDQNRQLILSDQEQTRLHDESLVALKQAARKEELPKELDSVLDQIIELKNELSRLDRLQLEEE